MQKKQPEVAMCRRRAPFADIGQRFRKGKSEEIRFAVYFTKLRYEARASISFSDNLLAILGIGSAAAS